MSLLVATVAAFAAGLAGAAHCLAMCGVISVTLARMSPPRVGFVVARQLGRVSAYTFAGAVIGGIGQTLLFIGHSGLLRLALQLLFARHDYSNRICGYLGCRHSRGVFGSGCNRGRATFFRRQRRHARLPSARSGASCRVA